ncbi:CocE/NonD family hydrolase [Candidatus Mycolicibacterium alkanivorans]|uniref:Peptidase S15 n=1 Tax=Candidatus Mycolicibacterium alkanivorans TaxID=2954114 RepID=A0ABS9YT49_9MYCO|nr:CocE/NonD family hydrolase [Candidatus Mycolicibacterium alkanivorans]MCI4674327.1 peptidase S15 [Candidatus Mycolicibacterium alkanivorans]
MGAARFVGRVGGLAVALGVGVAVFTGNGVAWADGGASSDSGTGGGARQHTSQASDTKAGPRASTRGSKKSHASSTGGLTSRGGPHSSTSTGAGDSTSPKQTDTGNADSATTDTSEPSSDPAPATPAAAVSGILTAAATNLLDPSAGGNSPSAPADSPLSWAVLAVTRRQALSAASVSPTAAQTTTSASQTTPTASLSSGLPVNANLFLADGIITGDPGAGLPAGAYTYTVVNAPSAGGKITFLTTPTPGSFTYLPDVSVLSSGTETFGIRVSQVSQLDQFVTGIPILGLVVSPVIDTLHQVPILSDLLAPLIGVSTVAAYTADPSALNTLGAPLAYTAMITSFDGTSISTNFFPATGVPLGTAAPTILNGPGLASPGATNPFAEWTSAGASNLVVGIKPLRDAGYDVITWDPRGEFASGGVLQLDSPAFEGQDVKSIISWAAGLNTAGVDNPYVSNIALNSPGDPKIGMVGGSYGGGIQLASAGIDPRIDAIVPGIAWNSLTASLYPDSAFKTSYASLLLLSLVTTGARINNQLYLGIATGDLLGWLSQTALAALGNAGPDYVLANVKAATLFIQGTVDVLFPLNAAIANSQQLTGLPPNQVKMIWYCGGHGVCLNPQTPLQSDVIKQDTMAWLDQYVNGGPVNGIPKFQWVDQNGNFYYSGKLPSDATFNSGAITGTAAGGLLGIVPLVGGSGPSPKASLPYSLGLGAPASNAINVPIAAPGTTEYIAGAPTVTFDYQGLGTGRFVYAQVVDNNTGRVVGNIVTPIPVTLDGRSHQITVPVPLNDIAYTYAPTDSLTLQITSSATAFENFTAFGVVNISDVNVSIPTIDPGNVTPETTPIT